MTTPTAAVARGGLGRAERSRGRASWALAARLARREVRRRKGRTALVVALVAIPVIAMTIASVVFHTARDTSAEEFARTYGNADLAVFGRERQPGFEGDRIIASLPVGSRVVVVHEIYDMVTPAGGRPQFTRFTDLPLADSITDGIVDIVDGRAPLNAGEVLLSPNLAEWFGVEVGDPLAMDVPAATFQVVGVGRPANTRDSTLLVVAGFDFDSVRLDRQGGMRLIDTPNGFDVAEFVDDGDVFGRATEPSSYSRQYLSVGAGVAWGWVGGALALTVMGIIIAAAFATSARRQLATLGQLASNGADRPVLRRMLALQGAWSGAIGAVFGIAIGLVLILPQHGLLERIVNHSLGPMEVAPLDLIVIALTGAVAATVAAFVPSRGITRVPVLSALGGRRPLGAVPRWLVPLGVVLFAGGLALIGLAVASDSVDNTDDRNLTAGISVVGGLGVLFGMCCSTTAIIALLGPIAERSTGTARLAARSLTRARTRSAAIIAAIAAAGALSIAGGTAIATSWDRDDSLWSTVPYLPAHMVSVQAYSAEPRDGEGGGTVSDPAAWTSTPVPAEVAAQVREVLDGSTAIPVRMAAFDLAQYRTDVVSPPDRWLTPEFVVADPDLLDAIGLSGRDRSVLERGGVLAGSEGSTYAPPGTVTAETESGPFTFEAARLRDRPRMMAYAQTPMLSPAKADELGLAIGSSETLFVGSHPLTDAQRRELEAITGQGDGVTSSFTPETEIATTAVSVNQGYDLPGKTPKALIDGLVVGGASLFILAVVAVGLALSAAESRDERDVLLAIGAPPRVMRRVSAQKAVLLTASGGVLAVPTGFLPVAVVLAEVDDHSIRFPWLVALGCVVVVPLLVGAATLAGSAIVQRVRPIHMSTLATD